MATITNLGTIHVFPSLASYNTNKTSVGTNDLVLLPTTTGEVVDSYRNGSNWYRIWSNGWVEQGGIASGTGRQEFLVPFASDQYCLVYGNTNNDSDGRTAKKISGSGSAFTVSAGNSKSWQGWTAFGIKGTGTDEGPDDDEYTYTIRGKGYYDWDSDEDEECYFWISDSISPTTFNTFTIDVIEVRQYQASGNQYFDLWLSGSGTKPSKLYVRIDDTWLTLNPVRTTVWYRSGDVHVDFPDNTDITIEIRDTAPT